MEIKDGQIKYTEIPEIKETDKSIDYETIKGKPTFTARTSISADLSGGAVTLVVLYTKLALELTRAFLLFTEASSADGGVAVKIGKANGTAVDDDYYRTSYTTDSSKTIWDTQELTLEKKDVAAGDTVTFYSAGGKTGTGEVMLILEYQIKEIYKGT